MSSTSTTAVTLSLGRAFGKLYFLFPSTRNEISFGSPPRVSSLGVFVVGCGQLPPLRPNFQNKTSLENHPPTNLLPPSPSPTTPFFILSLLHPQQAFNLFNISTSFSHSLHLLRLPTCLLQEDLCRDGTPIPMKTSCLRFSSTSRYLLLISRR